MDVKSGTANVSVSFAAWTTATGAAVTVTSATAGLALWWRRDGETKTALASVNDLATLDAAHNDEGILVIAGQEHRFDLPDAAFLTGVSKVQWGGEATGITIDGGEANLVAYDPSDAVRMGLTALPNAAADAAGGLPISDSGGLDLDTKLANTNEVTAARMGALTDWINGGRLDLILDIIAADVVNLDGAAMRGTDSAALASVCTEARLAELDAANVPGVLDTVAVDVAGLDGAVMRGTDSAALATTALSTAQWTNALATALATLAGHDPGATIAKAGDEMDLVDAPNATARTAIGVTLEAMILDEGDATALLAAIAAKIEEFLINEGDSTATMAAIATAVRSELATELARIDAAITSRNSTVPDAAGVVATALGLLETHGDSTWATATGFLDAAAVRTAIGLAAANLDTQLATLSTHDAAAVVSAMQAVAAQFKATGFAVAGDLMTLTAAYDAAKTADANLTEIMGTTLTGTAAQIAAAFVYFLDVATPSKTINDVGVAGSGLTAQQVWEYAARTLTVKTGFKLASDALDLIIAEVGTDGKDTINMRQAISLIVAGMAAAISRLDEDWVTKGANSSVTRITHKTTDGLSRTDVVLTPPT